MSNFSDYARRMPYDPELGDHISKRSDMDEELYECAVCPDPDSITLADLISKPLRTGQSLSALSTQSSDPEESGPCSSRTSGTHRISSQPTLLKISPEGPYFSQMATIFKTLTQGESSDYVRGVADALSKVQMMIQTDQDSKRLVIETRTDLMEKIQELTGLVETLTMRTAPASTTVSPRQSRNFATMEGLSPEAVAAALQPQRVQPAPSKLGLTSVTPGTIHPITSVSLTANQMVFNEEQLKMIASWNIPVSVHSGLMWAQGKLMITNFQIDSIRAATSEAERKLILRDLISAMYGQNLMAISEMRIMLDSAMKWKPTNQ